MLSQYAVHLPQLMISLVTADIIQMIRQRPSVPDSETWPNGPNVRCPSSRLTKVNGSKPPDALPSSQGRLSPWYLPRFPGDKHICGSAGMRLQVMTRHSWTSGARRQGASHIC